MYRVIPALSGLALLMAAAGCAVRAPQTYRLTGQTLVPPGVANADTARRTVVTDVPLKQRRCGDAAIEIVRRGKRARVTVARDALAGKPAGWLANWTAALESEGCLAPGEGSRLASTIAESVPMDASGAFRLLYNRQWSFMDIGPGNRLQVDSPIVKEGTPPDAPLVDSEKVTGSGTTLTVEMKASPNLVGFERAWYAVRPKASGVGFAIEPLYAESHIQGNVDRQSGPRTNYFQFAPDAAFYRIFYRGDQTIILLSAPNRAELERETRALETDPGACGSFAAKTCVMIPHKVGVNADIVALVNGTEVALPLGSTVASAIREAGEKRPDTVLPALAVRKSYAGKLTAVEFDRSKNDILRLTLLGGEEISWR